VCKHAISHLYVAFIRSKCTLLPVTEQTWNIWAAYDWRQQHLCSLVWLHLVRHLQVRYDSYTTTIQDQAVFHLFMTRLTKPSVSLLHKQTSAKVTKRVTNRNDGRKRSLPLWCNVLRSSQRCLLRVWCHMTQDQIPQPYTTEDKTPKISVNTIAVPARIQKTHLRDTKPDALLLGPSISVPGQAFFLRLQEIWHDEFRIPEHLPCFNVLHYEFRIGN
jgi:hypothetical protein